MNLPSCGDCRAMLAILTTSLALALPMAVGGAAEQNPPAPSSSDVPPTRAEDVLKKSADERWAELEARVAKLEQELRQLRAAAQSAAAALASTTGSSDTPGVERRGTGITTGDTSNRGGSTSMTPAPNVTAQQSAAHDRNSFSSLSDESKKEFFVEMRALVESMPNASPEERSNAVREIMNRLRARDEARKSGSDVSSKGNPANNNSSNLADALPKMPEGKKAPDSTQAPPATAERTASDDETRRRFEALTAEKRNQFIHEMRNMREKMQYATPEERGAMVKELLTKVEQETAKPPSTPEAPIPAPPPPATPPQAPGKVK